MSYPSSIDSLPATSAQGTTLLATNDHANDHRTLGNAVIALETKLGVSAGTPGNGQLLQGNGAGSSIWSQTWANGIVVSPQINGGTINTPVIGTPTISQPTINLGGDATGDILYRNSGGSLTRIPIGTANQYLKTDGTTPSWGTIPAVTGGTVIVAIPSADSVSFGDSGADVYSGSIVLQNASIVKFEGGLDARTSTNPASFYTRLVLGGTTVLNGPNVHEPAADRRAFNGIVWGTSLAAGTYTVKWQAVGGGQSATYTVGNSSFMISANPG